MPPKGCSNAWEDGLKTLANRVRPEPPELLDVFDLVTLNNKEVRDQFPMTLRGSFLGAEQAEWSWDVLQELDDPGGVVGQVVRQAWPPVFLFPEGIPHLRCKGDVADRTAAEQSLDALVRRLGQDVGAHAGAVRLGANIDHRLDPVRHQESQEVLRPPSSVPD